MREGSETNNEVTKPHPLIEAPVHLSDRTIVVIPTDHGESDTFPGRKQTLEDIEYSGKPDMLVFDSFPIPSIPRWKEQVEAIVTGKTTDNDFFSTAVKYAADNNIPLIGADPVHSIPGFLDYLDLDTAFRGNSYRESLARENIRKAQELEDKRDALVTNDKSFGKIVMSLLLTGASFGALKNKNISRRDFFKKAALGGLLGAAALSTSGAKEKLDVVSELESIDEEAEANQEKSANNIQQAKDAETSDLETLISVFNKSGKELDPSIQSSDEFQRLVKRYEQSGVATIVLRNALIAEVLSQPLPKLGYTGEKKPQITVVMGLGHSVVKPEHTISAFVQDETLRHEVIDKTLDHFLSFEKFMLAPNTLTPNFLSIISGVQSFAKRYDVSSEGKTTEQQIPLPYLVGVTKEFLNRNKYD